MSNYKGIIDHSMKKPQKMGKTDMKHVKVCVHRGFEKICENEQFLHKVAVLVFNRMQGETKSECAHSPYD